MFYFRITSTLYYNCSIFVVKFFIFRSRFGFFSVFAFNRFYFLGLI